MAVEVGARLQLTIGVVRERLLFAERQLARDTTSEAVVPELGRVAVRVRLGYAVAELVVAVACDQIHTVNIRVRHRGEAREEVVTVFGPDPHLVNACAAVALRVVLPRFVRRVGVSHTDLSVQLVVSVRNAVLIRVGDRDLIAGIVVGERRRLVERIRDADPATCIVVAVCGGMAQLVDALLHAADFVVLGDPLAGICIRGRRQPTRVVVAE